MFAVYTPSECAERDDSSSPRSRRRPRSLVPGQPRVVWPTALDRLTQGPYNNNNINVLDMCHERAATRRKRTRSRPQRRWDAALRGMPWVMGVDANGHEDGCRRSWARMPMGMTADAIGHGRECQWS
jgi:hypothetical protein